MQNSQEQTQSCRVPTMQKLDLSYYCTICNLQNIEYTGVTKEPSVKLISINIQPIAKMKMSL